jgi:hypothetical protein
VSAQRNLDRPPVVIRTSRLSHAIALGIAALMFVLVWRQAELDVSLILLPVIVGLYCLWQLADPSVLILAPEGVTWRNTFVSRRWAWNEIGNFTEGPLGSVACDLSDTRSPLRVLRPFNKSLSGRHGMFGFAWEGGARSAVAMLQAAQARWWHEANPGA